MTSNTQHLKDTKDNPSKEHKDNEQEKNQHSSDKKDDGNLNKKQVHGESHHTNKTK